MMPNQPETGIPWLERAASAYRVYTIVLEGLNHKGGPLPTFADLTDKQKAAWEAVARHESRLTSIQERGPIPELEELWYGWHPEWMARQAGKDSGRFPVPAGVTPDEPTPRPKGRTGNIRLLTVFPLAAGLLLLAAFVVGTAVTRHATREAPMPAETMLAADREHQAYLRFAAGDCEGCLALAAELPWDSARRHYLCGLVHQRRGEMAAARHCYTVAHRLGDPVATRKLRALDG